MFRKASPASKAKTKASPTGRERLHYFNEQLSLAAEAVLDLEHRVVTLEKIGTDAIAADQALQAFIKRDDGVAALAAHSAGEIDVNAEICTLLHKAKSTSEAAGPAAAALPAAKNALDFARSEVVRLEQEKAAEISRFMTSLADNLAREYKTAFEKACRLHDELMGFANGTSVYVGEIAMIVEDLKLPRFNLPALACLNDHDPFLRHRANTSTVDSASRTWAEVRTRLESDVDSDLTDIVPA